MKIAIIRRGCEIIVEIPAEAGKVLGMTPLSGHRFGNVLAVACENGAYLVTQDGEVKRVELQ